MIDKVFRWPRVCAHVLASPAGPYLDDLTTTLARQGFGRWKVRQRIHGAAHFSLVATRTGTSLATLHEDMIPAFRAHLQTCRCRKWLRHGRHADVSAVAGARALVEHLRHMAVVTSPAPMPTAPDLPPLVRRFHTWMQQQRGVHDTTVRSYERVIGDALQTRANEHLLQADGGTLPSPAHDYYNEFGLPGLANVSWQQSARRGAPQSAPPSVPHDSH